ARNARNPACSAIRAVWLLLAARGARASSSCAWRSSSALSSGAPWSSGSATWASRAAWRCAAWRPKATGAVDKLDLLVQRHLLDDQVGPPIRRQALVLPALLCGLW